MEEGLPGREKTIGTCNFSQNEKARVWSLFKMFQNGTPITGPGLEYLASGDFHKCKLHLSGKAGIKSNSVVQTKAAGNQHIIF